MSDGMTSPLFGLKQDIPTNDDWYTPKWIFDLMAVEFDLDVAAPPGGVPWIPAQRFYTVEDDGLVQPWDGLVWCNPPYSVAGRWARRWITHRDGLILVPYSKSNWLPKVMSQCDLIAIPTGFNFDSHDGISKGIAHSVWLGARGKGVAPLDRLLTAMPLWAGLVPRWCRRVDAND